MGIEALYRKQNTSKPAPGHRIYPCLLRKLSITYISIARRFIYLAAVLDWVARRPLAWRVSIPLEADFCIEAVGEALARHGTPEILNTDQGSQFTSIDFIKVLAAREIKISMDGSVAWRDNVFVGRLWRTISYLRAYTSVSEARAGIVRLLTFYNFASLRPFPELLGRRFWQFRALEYPWPVGKRMIRLNFTWLRCQPQRFWATPSSLAAPDRLSQGSRPPGSGLNTGILR